MNNTRIIIYVAIGLLVGLVAGYFLYAPISKAIDLNAGGLVTPVSNGIWTGTEYTKPWEWSGGQWTTFVSCLNNRHVQLNANIETADGRWYRTNDGGLVAKCATTTISKSTFAGTVSINFSAKSDVDSVIAHMDATISATGAIKGKVNNNPGIGNDGLANTNTATYPPIFPDGTSVSGYINSDGDATMQVGKETYKGHVFNNATSGSGYYIGAAMDTTGLLATSTHSVFGANAVYVMSIINVVK